MVDDLLLAPTEFLVAEDVVQDLAGAVGLLPGPSVGQAVTQKSKHQFPILISTRRLSTGARS